MSHYTTCSVGLTIYNRRNWAENTDPAFMDMRHQELLHRLSTPRKEWRCQDSGVGFDCCCEANVCRRCDCCGAWICYDHCRISTTYNGERARLCSRCHGTLTIPENEMLASMNAYKNEREFVARPGSWSDHAPSTPSVAQAVTPGPANPIFHAPPRRLFNRRRCKTRVSDANFRIGVPATSNGGADSAPSTDNEILQPTSEGQPRPEESQGAGAASADGVNVEDDGLTAAAMEENWTFEESRRYPDLFRYLTIIHHVRFGDEETTMVTEKVIELYARENDSLPWTTGHTVEVPEADESTPRAETTAFGPAECPSSPGPAPTSANEEVTTTTTDNAPSTAAGGFLAGLPQVSRRSTMFGMAAVAVGLMAWGARRR